MLTGRWEQIEQIFNEAVLMPANERSSFVEQICGADTDLRFEIFSLLEADNQSDEILEQSVFPLVAKLIDDNYSHLLEKSDFATYKLKRLLGRGGMGAVFLAEDTQLERFVALKILSAEIADGNSENALRFQQEAKAISSVCHQHVAHIYEFGKYEEMFYFAMEYIPGKTLRQLLNEKQIEVSVAVEIALQIASALECAHTELIVHRDIKPENIMLRQRAIVTEEISIRVLDFGLAKFIEQKRYKDISLLDSGPGVIMGTPAYMSPEQIRGETIDKRTDLWSLGVVLYEMVTGVRPFEGETASDTIAAILITDPLPPSVLNASVPLKLEHIVLKMLQKERDNRFQTANDLYYELQQIKKSLDFENNRVSEEREQIQSFRNYFVGNWQYQKVFYIGIVVLLFLVSALGFWRFNSEGAKSTKYQPIKSIAVLPFQIESDIQENEFLADGITELIINRLSQIPNLSVKARGSVFQYRGKTMNPQIVSKELSVQVLLLGNISRFDNNLTINLEVVDGATGNQIWGNQYKRKASDLISLQNDITLDVSRKLQVKLSETDKDELTKLSTENLEAYQLYLKGRFYWNKRTASDLQKSTEYFNRAIALDPNFAMAYSGLANSYVLFSGFGVASPQESFPKAEESAKKALELDETLADAHVALGYVLFNYYWNFEESEKHMMRALELNANSVIARHWYGNANLLAAGRFDEAIEELKRAQKLDPLSLIINADLGNSYLFARQTDQAIEQFQKTIEMDGNFYYAHAYLGRAYMMKGLFNEAFLEFKKAQSLSDDPRILMLIACNYSKMGKKDKAISVLEQMKNLSEKRYVSSYYFALVYTALGKNDEALKWLEKAYHDHEGRLTLITVDPLLDDLRSDSRFEELIRRVGLNK